jgi:hypothetical protein
VLFKNKTKFSNRRSGPYRILKLKSPNATLQDLANLKKIFKVHVNKLKKFNEPFLLPFTGKDEIERNEFDPNLEREDSENSDNEGSDREYVEKYSGDPE